MSDYETETPTSISFVKWYFEQKLTSLLKELGAVVGQRERAEYERMVKHVEREASALRGTIEAMRKVIESQNERIKSIEAMFGQPEQQSHSAGRRLM